MMMEHDFIEKMIIAEQESVSIRRPINKTFRPSYGSIFVNSCADYIACCRLSKWLEDRRLGILGGYERKCYSFGNNSSIIEKTNVHKNTAIFFLSHHFNERIDKITDYFVAQNKLEDIRIIKLSDLVYVSTSKYENKVLFVNWDPMFKIGSIEAQLVIMDHDIKLLKVCVSVFIWVLFDQTYFDSSGYMDEKYKKYRDERKNAIGENVDSYFLDIIKRRIHKRFKTTNSIYKCVNPCLLKLPRLLRKEIIIKPGVNIRFKNTHNYFDKIKDKLLVLEPALEYHSINQRNFSEEEIGYYKLTREDVKFIIHNNVRQLDDVNFSDELAYNIINNFFSHFKFIAEKTENMPALARLYHKVIKENYPDYPLDTKTVEDGDEILEVINKSCRERVEKKLVPLYIEKLKEPCIICSRGNVRCIFRVCCTVRLCIECFMKHQLCPICKDTTMNELLMQDSLTITCGREVIAVPSLELQIVECIVGILHVKPTAKILCLCITEHFNKIEDILITIAMKKYFIDLKNNISSIRDSREVNKYEDFRHGLRNIMIMHNGFIMSEHGDNKEFDFVEYLLISDALSKMIKQYKETAIKAVSFTRKWRFNQCDKQCDKQLKIIYLEDIEESKYYAKNNGYPRYF